MNSRPVLAGVLGALVIAFSGILVRLADVSPSTAAVFRCLWALPPLALLAWLERRRYGRRTRRDRLIALGAGVIFAVNLTVWHHAIEAVGAGLSTVLGGIQVMLVPLFAWAVLGERPENRALAAIPVVFTGVVLISGVIGAGAYGDDPVLGVILGVLTAIAYSLFILTLRQGNTDERRPAGPLFDATLVAALAILAAGAPLGELRLEPSWPAHGWLVVLALTSQVLGWLLITSSLPRLPAAQSSVLLTIQPVGSVLLAIAIFGESPTVLQAVGVVAILSGLLAVGARRPEVPSPGGLPRGATTRLSPPEP
jgi:drug/metabolite transporter (DMT)-like permease